MSGTSIIKLRPSETKINRNLELKVVINIKNMDGTIEEYQNELCRLADLTKGSNRDSIKWLLRSLGALIKEEAE